MNTSHKKDAIISLKESVNKLNNLIENLDEMFGDLTKSKFFDILIEIVHNHKCSVKIMLDDKTDWLGWSIYENNWGDNQYEVKLSEWENEMKVKNIDELLFVIDEENKKEQIKMNWQQNDLKRQIWDAQKRIDESPHWIKEASKFQGSDVGTAPQSTKGDNNMYNELIEIRNKVDELIEKCQSEPEFDYVGVGYGKNGKYGLYLSPKHTEKVLNWYDAKEYCKSLNADLPTIGELQLLCDNHKESFENCCYWSSIDVYNIYSAFAFSFSFYNVSTSSDNKHNTRYVRAVKRVKL